MPESARSNGRASRRAILDRGLTLAATGGRHAATIGALAGALGMSKSGVFAHFGSKDALDVAVIEAAAARFTRAVVAPSEVAPAGLARLAALCEGFLTFVTTAEAGSPSLTPDHPAFGVGASEAVHARQNAWRDQWQDALTTAVAMAISQGELAASVTPGQAVFELHALLEGAGRAAFHLDSSVVTERTRRAIDRLMMSWSED